MPAFVADLERMHLCDDRFLRRYLGGYDPRYDYVDENTGAWVQWTLVCTSHSYSTLSLSISLSRKHTCCMFLSPFLFISHSVSLVCLPFDPSHIIYMVIYRSFHQVLQVYRTRQLLQAQHNAQATRAARRTGLAAMKNTSQVLYIRTRQISWTECWQQKR
jgi:hypothetical protein